MQQLQGSDRLKVPASEAQPHRSAAGWWSCLRQQQQHEFTESGCNASNVRLPHMQQLRTPCRTWSSKTSPQRHLGGKGNSLEQRMLQMQ
jgi:hypothetical protein